MAQKRPGDPYIWVTTLAKLLTGENSCEWAGWFKAHHRNWKKPLSDFDSTKWMLDHTALVNQEREGLETLGYEVYTENQNLFRLSGTSATIAGKPDLIGEKTNEILISDAKTGQPSPSHRAQIQIYQYAVPKALLQYRDKPAKGQVRYPDSHVGSPASAVSPDFVANMSGLIRRLADHEPARRVPSAQECRFCDITSEDCPVRIDTHHVPAGTSDDF